DGLEREAAAGARPVLHHDRLAKPLRQSLADQPSDDIGCAAGRREDHERDRPRRIALRPAGARHGSEDTRCSELQKPAAPNFHDGLPCSLSLASTSASLARQSLRFITRDTAERINNPALTAS